MKCKYCGGHHLRRFEAIYQEGRRVGSSIGPRYDVQYESSTVLAMECAPPNAPEGANMGAAIGITFLYVLALISAAAVLFIVGRSFSASVGVVIALPTLALAWMIVSKLEKNIIEQNRQAEEKQRENYNLAMHQWKNSWWCRQCGQSAVYEEFGKLA